MKYVPVWTYDNYVSAHIAMGRLEEDGYTCWLKDENTVTIDPILTNAIGGIKLMVAEPDAKSAWELLKKLQREHKALIPCPKCGSHNTESVSTPRKASNWFSAFIGMLVTNFALPVETVNHCFDCGTEFPEILQEDKSNEKE